MIHHVSITARRPAHVADVLAELVGGRSLPFPVFPGGHIALADDAHGTGIEVYPLGTELLPGGRSDPVHGVTNALPPIFSGTRVTLSVALSEDAVKDIAHREGWRAETASRGRCPVIELWIENRILLEVLTPTMAETYCQAFGLEHPAATNQTEATTDPTAGSLRPT